VLLPINEHHFLCRRGSLNERGEECQGHCFCDFDVGELAGEGRRAVEDDNPIGRGSPDKLWVIAGVGGIEVRLFAWAFNKDFDGLAEKIPAKPVAGFFMLGVESAIALFFHFGRDIIRQELFGFGGRARRVLEDKGVFVACLSDKFDGGLEIVVGFVREADDKVACNSDIWDDGPCSIEQVEVLVGGVTAVHSFEDFV
jgi:hypothetical protein